MKHISWTPKISKRSGTVDHPNCLHIETELGIINIYVGLTDAKGRKVEAVEILPDDHYAGEPKVRFERKTMRLIQPKTKPRRK
jgi:hypothetical protein